MEQHKTHEELIEIAQRAWDLKPKTDAAFAKAMSPGATLEDLQTLGRLMEQIDGEGDGD